ncbi:MULTISPECIES: MgtC/SapB family protein [Ramlibacter]|uniref:Protein MgtC n=1 Tax=Ramlibacter pinisoli TaxID=2682844 RepID=A0A6N8J0F2_9BURK|nr:MULTISPECIES: MgtC/SapB family protein [Ramlibacter]MBA2962635.1 MgtC/SapB family protein [Ramlibacter sp. CGMCC 1.13660]MVQ32577.1 MgtC/SapB family protein [Ramlibacter pinisoli]
MDVVLATVASEFSDIRDLESFVRALVRLLLAALLGGLLGLERELTGKPAGLRTHMLVALGSAMFMLAARRAGLDEEGVSRVIQGLLAGVGFLCAGSILKADDQEHVYGLTTAAGLWMTAAIGLAAGLGLDALAVLSTLLTLGILLLEIPLRNVIQNQRRRRRAAVDDGGPGAS